MEIVIIGTGNTASVLGRKLKAAGHDIVQIYGRDAKAATELAYILDTESTNYWSVVNRNADVYLIAVSDIAIEEVLKELQLPEKTIVHTAASVSKNIFKKSNKHFGVFYPLQSLKKEVEHLPEVPIIIDASDEETLHLLEDLGSSISSLVVQADDKERLKMHLAAVICNNFVNHLYSLAEKFCIKEGIDFKLMIPLIRETANRIETISPTDAQTGPAVRNDEETIKKHLTLLKKHPELKEIYQLFTNSISINK